MTNYSNENSGALFVNEKRQKPSQAAFKGQFHLNSEEKTHWMDAWGRVNAEGKTYLEVQLTEMLPAGSDYADAERMTMNLFAVEKASDKAPDFKGEVEMPNGDVMEAAGWKRTFGGGKQLISIKISEPFKAEAGAGRNMDAEVDIFGCAAAPAEVAVEADEVDEDVPF